MKSVSRVQTQERVLNQIQDNLIKSITDLNAIPLNSGVLLSDIVLASGSNTIYTTLPQAITGWIVTRKSANEDIYDEQSTNINPKTLILNSSGAVTVSLFVF